MAVDDGYRLVGRAIVDDDDFETVERLASNALEGIVNRCFRIECANHNADQI